MSKVSFMTKNFHRYDPMSIESYLAIGGFNALKKAVTMDGEDIASLLSEAQIKGRGGAAYPMGRKWSQARAVKGEHKVIICNADEGEPCTFKDRELITNDPFNLIEAMTIGAWSIRAQDGYIYLREEYAHLRSRLKNAIEEAERCGFLGKNILGKEDFDFHIHLRSGAGAYVCGEGTALIRSIEGKAGRPRMKPPFIKQSGLFALPTCVNNVESLSIVPHLLLDDTKEYISYGSGESLGTKLVSVGGNVNRPAVFEIPFGTTVREIIYDLAGGIQGGRRIRLIQFGGASGKIADESILDVPYTYDDLKAAGVSCGQCTPCREGVLHIKLILEKFAQGTATEKDLENMKMIVRIMPMSALCGLGESAENALSAAFKLFPETFRIGGVH